MSKKHASPAANLFPADWPAEGPIDLDIHDLPHASSSTEWWYMHSHIQTADKKSFSVFASFFKSAYGYDKKTKTPLFGYSVIWAISDLDKKKYHTVSLVDQNAPKIGIGRIERGELVKDPHLKRAALGCRALSR
jgi:predicted secreted hydrolase